MRKAELYHYGIKGQKRGLRRYQYSNNTYTPLGNLRYRPPKERSLAPAAVIGGSGLAMAATIAHATGFSIAKAVATVNSIATVPVSTASTAVSVGAAAVAAIPTPVWAVALPLAAVYASTVLIDMSDEIRGK